MPTAVPRKHRLRRLPRKYLIVVIITIVTMFFIIWSISSPNFITPLLAGVGILVNIYQWLLPTQNELLQSSPTAMGLVQGNPNARLAVRSGQGGDSIEALPSLSISTFFCNVPLPDIQEFYGRNSESAMLMRRIQNRASTSIIGPRRIGKTWLLQYIHLLYKTDQMKQIGYLDASLPRCKNVSNFTSLALDSLKKTTGTHARGLESLENFVRVQGLQQHTPVLLIDEFEGFATDPEQFNLEFFNGLRSIAGMGLVLITVSRKPLLDIVSDIVKTEEAKTSPFFNIFVQRTLKPFTLQEAEAFVTMKSQQLQLTVQEQKLILQCGRHENEQWLPLRLQMAGSLLLEDKFADEQGHKSYNPDDPDYRESLRKRLDDDLPRTN